MLTYLQITLHGQYYSSTTNLPPWLTTKKTFCDVNLVYTREGDRKKWEHRCVSTTSDVTKPRGSFEFMLRAICMWSLHDYLAYGLFVSCQTKAIWHAFSVVQNWILDVPHTWKKMCILDTDITMLKATHIGEIMMYSIDKWSPSLHHLEFMLLIFYKGLKNVRHGWQEDSTH